MDSFRKRYKKRVFSSLALSTLAFVISLLFLTIGFSVFQASVEISNITAVIRVQKDIRVTGVYAINATNGASSNYEEYDVNRITEIYKKINSNIDSNLEIKSKTVNLKEALCDDSNSTECKLGSVTTFDITIGYKNNGYNGTDLTHLIELEFDFRRVFNITYSGFSGNTSGLPSQMIDGDTKTITFNATSGIPTNVVVTGASGSYSSPTLTLSNVTIQNLVDTIVVTKAYSITYSGFSGNTSGLPQIITASGGTITFDSTSGIPTNVSISGGATGNYVSPTLTINPGVTGDITITVSNSGGGDQPAHRHRGPFQLRGPAGALPREHLAAALYRRSDRGHVHRQRWQQTTFRRRPHVARLEQEQVILRHRGGGLSETARHCVC